MTFSHVVITILINRTNRLNDQGLAKLNEARAGGTGKLPDWLKQEMDHDDLYKHTQ